MPAVFGIEPDGEEGVRAAHLATVGEFHDHTVTVARDGIRAALVEDRHAVALEDRFDDGGGVGILSRQHLVAARDERDLRAEGEVGGGELRSRDTRSDDDEVLGDGFERVQLGPGEDALAVGLRGRQDARGRADRDHEGVGVDRVEVGAALAPAGRDDDRVGVFQTPVALHDAHTGPHELRLHVG